ncbi:hypothetical protein ISS86_00780 [Candidatus Microgenomates bacterium]|nr:hypothetical protein [Candidatus Microgenomates bacterium]
MPEPTPAEVIPKALARERLPVAPGPDSVEAVAQRIIDNADEKRWRETLQLERRASIEDDQINKRIEQIGVGERDPNTGDKKRSTEEQKKFDEAKKEADLIKKYLEQGYDKLNNTEKTKLRTAVMAECNRRPALAAEIAAMTGNQPQEFLERILKDPELSQHAQEIFEALLDPSKDLADVIAPIQKALEEAEFKLEEKKGDFGLVEWQLERTDVRLAEYEDRTSLKGKKGEKLDELELLRKDEPALIIERDERQANLQALTSRYETFERDINATRDAIQKGRDLATYGLRPIDQIEAEAKGVLQRARTEQLAYNKAQAALDRKAALEQEFKEVKPQLEERVVELKKELKEKEIDVKKAKAEVGRRQQELAGAKNLRASQEQDIVNELKNVIGEATSEWLNAEAQRLTNALNEELTVLREKTKELQEKLMYEAVQEELTKEKTGYWGIQRILHRKKETRRFVDEKKAEKYYNTLITKGPEEAMKELLMTRENPENPGNNYTEDEAKAIVADKEYAEKVQPEVIKQLLARQLITGGIRQEDIYFITTSQWGKGMIEQALALNEEFRKNVDGVMGANALVKRGFWEKFRQQMRKHPWWWLLLLGAPVAYGISAARMPQEEEELRAV